MNIITNLLRKSLISSFSKVEKGELHITLPNGENLEFKGQHKGVIADWQIKTWRAIVNISIKGDVGFAEEYRDGNFETSDLKSLLLFGCENEEVLNSYVNGSWIFQKISSLICYVMNRNTLKGSEKNIHAHYD